MKNYSILILFAFVSLFSGLYGQNQDSLILRKIYDYSLTEGDCYENLRELCKEVGPRLSGSPGAARAVEWGQRTMEKYGFDSVWLQPVTVPYWVRGDQEEGRILNSKGKPTKVKVCALGGSIGTQKNGISAEVVEVQDFDELAKLPREAVEGKIVFFNRPMDKRKVNTFAAYGGCVNQRSQGAVEAAHAGAIAVLVRSMSLDEDDHPHTGSMHYDTTIHKIPAAAISTNDANRLSQQLKADPKLNFYLKMNCEDRGTAESFNVVGQITGTEFPDEYIVIGGHLDSWDTGEGAHDDGTGIVQSIEVLAAFAELGIKPKRTIRACLYMNEENGIAGGFKYAELAEQNNEKHIVALESDRGGFTPRGFTIEGDTNVFLIRRFAPLFKPYYIHFFEEGYGGVDIHTLRTSGTKLIGFVPDSQRYFDYHHSEADVFENVDQRELQMGAATMTSLIYLFTEYGIQPGADN